MNSGVSGGAAAASPTKRTASAAADVAAASPTKRVLIRAPLCDCAEPRASTRRETGSGTNKGRFFWSCNLSHCSFFRWCDDKEAGTRLGLPGPACTCGVPSLERVTKKPGPNHGRVFFNCAGGRCKFFQWADQCGAAAAATTSFVEIEVRPPALCMCMWCVCVCMCV